MVVVETSGWYRVDSENSEIREDIQVAGQIFSGDGLVVKGQLLELRPFLEQEFVMAIAVRSVNRWKIVPYWAVEVKALRIKMVWD